MLRKSLNNIKTHNFNSEHVRKTFLDYFIKENNHTWIRSSPVVPFCDPTLTFVNAGMNQFKGVFLGYRNSPSKRIANSQKCVRVGGKHCDLETVGTDCYHHTFFEMLGNWSFGDYWKHESCSMAWTLLTQIYALPVESLYVTYFAGDPITGLKPDLEVVDIWRTLGVPKERILPFGVKDNFWEMGLTGPCGPSTEIHYDHTKSLKNRSLDVNQGLSDLTELWNIVFIQYNRDINGSIQKCSGQFVDTGLGLERLTAVLQGQRSTYDTDLFLPLFEQIQRETGARNYEGRYGGEDKDGLDTAYRIVADHARCATVCLADGSLPDENYRLRKIIRRAMITGEKYFHTHMESLFWRVCDTVIESLGNTYPELREKRAHIKNILEYESEILKASRLEKNPEWNDMVSKNPKLEDYDPAEVNGLVQGYRALLKLNSDQIEPDLAFKLYDTYGLNEEKIQALGDVLRIPFDKKGFHQKMEEIKQRSKEHQNAQLMKGIPKTDDLMKYETLTTQGTLLNITRNNGDEVSLIFDRTCFYSTAGGQECDQGVIEFNDGKIQFHVTDVQSVNDVVVHGGIFKSGDVHQIKEGAIGVLKVNEKRRLGNRRNHTATHLLNAVIRRNLSSSIFQKSSKVTSQGLRFDLILIGKNRITPELISQIEDDIRNLISSAIPVVTKKGHQEDLFQPDVILVPGEVYPDIGVRIVDIKSDCFLSREACCGTHASNTSDLENFAITYLKKTGRVTYSLKAVTGDEAVNVRHQSDELETRLQRLYESVEKQFNVESVKSNIKKLVLEMNERKRNGSLSYISQYRCNSLIKKLNSVIKTTIV